MLPLTYDLPTMTRMFHVEIDTGCKTGALPVVQTQGQAKDQINKKLTFRFLSPLFFLFSFSFWLVETSIQLYCEL